MTTPNDGSRMAAPLDEQLVAYLDGELDPPSARRIEALLASEPEVRRRLQSLERTWDLLDELDLTPAAGPLVQTTLEMVAIAARGDVEQQQAEAPRRRRRWWLAAVFSLLAAAVVGFIVITLAAPDPNRQLLQDLPLLENFDQYRQIDSVDYLRRLRSEKLFSKEVAESARDAPPSGEDSPAQRRQYVENMDLGDKEQLLRSQERFANLEPAEQQRLRRLYNDVRQAADAEQLRSVLRRYGDWLKTLPSYTRAELLEVEPAERIQRVKRLQEEQVREAARRPAGKDTEVLLKWIHEYVAGHEKELIDALPKPQQENLSKLSEPMRRNRLALLQILPPRQAGLGKPPPTVTDEELKRLREQLSPERRKQLESLSPSQQWQHVIRWLRPGMRSSGGPHGARGPRTEVEEVYDQRLADFFEKDLTDKDRDRLFRLPGEEMQRELQQLFWNRVHPSEGDGRRPGRFGPAARPGGEESGPGK